MEFKATTKRHHQQLGSFLRLTPWSWGRARNYPSVHCPFPPQSFMPPWNIAISPIPLLTCHTSCYCYFTYKIMFRSEISGNTGNQKGRVKSPSFPPTSKASLHILMNFLSVNFRWLGWLLVMFFSQLYLQLYIWSFLFFTLYEVSNL